MPEEAKLDIASNGEFKKDIYIGSKVMDKFWIEDSDTTYGKPAKGKLEADILNECYEEVILLMENDCPDKLIMEGEVISDTSDVFRFDDETIMRSMVLEEELSFGDDDFDTKVSDGQENEEENKKIQDLNKETNVTNSISSYAIEEPTKSLVYDQENKKPDRENENIISGNDEEESVNILQHCSGSIPYSGSISLRSTSSTASTHSFAFPILAQEWNSSPVRMVKADKRHSIKQKLWNKKLNWICCKF